MRRAAPSLSDLTAALMVTQRSTVNTSAMTQDKHTNRDARSMRADRATAVDERKSHLRALAVAGTLAATGLFTAFAASASDDDGATLSADPRASGVATLATPSTEGVVDSDESQSEPNRQDDHAWKGRGHRHSDVDQDRPPADGFTTPQGDYFSQTPDGGVAPSQQNNQTAPSMSGGS